MTKKTIDTMLPVRKWLSFSEAQTYTGGSKDTLRAKIAEHDLTISADKYTTYYKVAELDSIFEALVIKRQVVVVK